MCVKDLVSLWPTLAQKYMNFWITIGHSDIIQRKSDMVYNMDSVFTDLNESVDT